MKNFSRIVVGLCLTSIGCIACSGSSTPVKDSQIASDGANDVQNADVVQDGTEDSSDLWIFPDTLSQDGVQDDVQLSCIPATDVLLCQNAGKNCGSVQLVDNCKNVRTVTCGQCAPPESCGGAGTDNVCEIAKWAKTIVDSGGEAGKHVAMIVDPNGIPHLSYQQIQNVTPGYQLKYAQFKQGAWSKTVLNQDVLAGEFTDIAWMPNGSANGNAPTVVAQVFGKPLYFTFDGAKWESSEIYEFAGRYSSLAIDSKGIPHVCHVSNPNNLTIGTLYYSTFDVAKKQWVTESTIDASASNTQWAWCDIAVDAQGNVHVAYEDQNWMQLKYAKHTNGKWTTEIVENTSSGKKGGRPSLKLTSTGVPAISYTRLSTNSSASDFAYAVKSTTAWNKGVITTTSSVPVMAALALDATGIPHVLIGNSSGQLIYAHQSSGAWDLETVATIKSGLDVFGDIEVDLNGKIHIVYYQSLTQNLEYLVEK